MADLADATVITEDELDSITLQAAITEILGMWKSVAEIGGCYGNADLHVD